MTYGFNDNNAAGAGMYRGLIDNYDVIRWVLH